ncbi:hypothetical protein [Myroides indicus]|uniref:Uncharacterized protein n=1 Tax=Myroides indicus TaxID=1323422 RepID=A0A4R7F2X1_9FLAO|nr:hypothetical protein [Myroides indicus]TDS64286.1 hypothetical protein C8P70_1042 [Myroides indicus]
MDKNRKKAAYKTYNPAIIRKLIEKYGFTPQFIGQSLRGERTSEASLRICEDYKMMERKINTTLKDL